jgi:pimeloyl-ACP methyl ester carboxylesterase
MGAYVAVLLASAAPALSERVVLVDGGLPRPRPSGDPDAVIEATIGPALTRLRMTFPTPEDYVAFWRQHPAFGGWNDDLDAYVRYDLTGEPGAMRSKVSEEAVLADGRDTLFDEEAFATAIRAIKCPITLVRAPRGLFDEPGGFQPDELVDAWVPRLDDFTVTTVPDTNHYSVQLAEPGAGVVAAAITSQ